MIIETFVIKKLTKHNHNRKKTILRMRCDYCQTIYERGINIKSYLKQKHHFCCLECTHLAAKKGEISHLTSIETCLQKYNTTSIMQINDVKTLRKNRSVQKWGTNSPMQNIDNQNKRKSTCIEKYGFETFFQVSNFSQIRIESMKQNGTSFNESKNEIKLYEWLLKVYPLTIRHQKCQNWCIDIFIPELNLYVQLDGIYWHGINRELDEILEIKRPQDKFIAYTKQNDQKQKDYFIQNNLKLLRITDKNFLKIDTNVLPTLEKLLELSYLKINI